MRINQKNKRLELLYFELSDALAQSDFEFTITPMSSTPVTYLITLEKYTSFRGTFKECESFIIGLQVGREITYVD